MESGEPDVVERYDVTHNSYDLLYREEQFSKYEYLFNDLNILPGDTIADIGCGTGLLYEFLRTMMTFYHKYVCIDPSDGMISEAVRKARNDPLIIFIVSFAENLPLVDNAVSDVFMITVWDNLRDPSMAVKEMKRVSREKIVITKLSKTNSPPPSLYDSDFKYEGTLIDDFYIFKRRYL
ncbi:MAG: methyltransferase domain-containing protein [Thermosphaera sp.]